MKTYITKIGTIALSLMLVGVGCSSLSGVSCDATTAHDSCISDGVDEALIGSWTLQSQSLSSSAGSITNPFSGRTLTFGNNGSYTDDYSTETVPDSSVYGITSSCEILGALSGSYVAESNLNLDLDPPPVVDELHIVPNGGSPQVNCQATGSVVSSNSASTPLGVGPVTGDPPYVLYTYTMDNSWSILTIVQQNQYANVTNTYVFTR